MFYLVLISKLPSKVTILIYILHVLVYMFHFIMAVWPAFSVNLLFLIWIHFPIGLLLIFILMNKYTYFHSYMNWKYIVPYICVFNWWLYALKIFSPGICILVLTSLHNMCSLNLNVVDFPLWRGSREQWLHT